MLLRKTFTLLLFMVTTFLSASEKLTPTQILDGFCAEKDKNVIHETSMKIMSDSFIEKIKDNQDFLSKLKTELRNKKNKKKHAFFAVTLAKAEDDLGVKYLTKYLSKIKPISVREEAALILAEHKVFFGIKTLVKKLACKTGKEAIVKENPKAEVAKREKIKDIILDQKKRIYKIIKKYKVMNAERTIKSLTKKKDYDLLPLALEVLDVLAEEKKQIKKNSSSMVKIEGKAPKGFSYNLHMHKPATDNVPDKLLIYMHGMGGPSNDVPEELLPEISRAGYALLCVKKKLDKWHPADVVSLKNTIKALQSQKGLDAKKPVIMSYSNGGQTVLRMWKSDPSQFGGLMICAAYHYKKLAGDPKLATSYKLAAIPKNPSVADVPILGLIGTVDAMVPVWQEAEKVFPKHGIDVEVHYVPGFGHTYLYNEIKKEMESWLRRIR